MKHDRIMLGQFCLYGLLKNQQYYEPFFLLALLEKLRDQDVGLALTWVGLLYGFRSLCVNLMEVPSGAAADVLGRRRSMITSFAGYIVSFLIFTYCDALWTLFVAMFFFAIGEAFRSGTHKAMIFDWLARNGRTSEKTAIYGLTRSWSKIGSAISALVAAAMVFLTGSFQDVFLICVVPYALNIVNFLFYPQYLDGDLHASHDMRKVFQTLWQSIRDCFHRGPLRRLLAESLAYEGVFKATKDYLQLMIKLAAVAYLAPRMIDYLQRTRGSDADIEKLCTTVVIGPVYFVLFLASSYASRHAKTLAVRASNEESASRWLWWGNFIAFAVLGAGLLTGQFWAAILALVAMFIGENFWRPIMVSRVADHAPAERQATILSVESQANSLAVAVLAPALAFTIDMLRTHTGSDNLSYLPLAAVGLVTCALVLLTGKRTKKEI